MGHQERDSGVQHRVLTKAMHSYLLLARPGHTGACVAPKRHKDELCRAVCHPLPPMTQHTELSFSLTSWEKICSAADTVTHLNIFISRRRMGNWTQESVSQVASLAGDFRMQKTPGDKSRKQSKLHQSPAFPFQGGRMKKPYSMYHKPKPEEKPGGPDPSHSI